MSLSHGKLVSHTVVGAFFLCLGGCGFNSAQYYVDATDPLPASALVTCGESTASGFLIDREERLLVTTQRAINQKGDLEVVFPVIENNKALVHKTAWLTKAGKSQR